MIALLVVTDGRRECIEQTIPSALAMLQGPITRRVIYDDSGSPDHRRWLAHHFPTFELIWHPDGRQGFGGAIRAAWRQLSAGDERYVFHLEDDFTFNQPVNLTDLVDVLSAHPYLVQLALRRQPWNDHERAAGGVVEQHPGAYTEVEWLGRTWLEHRLFFTTNPSLYRRTLCFTDWPEGPESEGRFSHELLQHGSPEVTGELVQFGFWGARDSGEAVEHIGHERNGTGY